MRKLHHIVSSDWHIKNENVHLLIELVSDQCRLAVQNGLTEIICLGDVFESRISQRIEVLWGFYRILEICAEYNVKLICIPGNHDKTSYTEEVSFLHPFKSHPNFHLIDSYECRCVDDIAYHYIPYFEENATYQSYLDKVEYQGKDVLFSHLAMTGSRNNDHTVIENVLTPENFSKFSKCYFGHYHNTQEITKKIIHVASIQQNNFGENDNKGYTLIYDDFTYEIINSEFKKYINIYFDLKKYSLNEVEDMLKNHDFHKAYYKLHFKGKKSELEALDINKYKDMGYVVTSIDPYIETQTVEEATAMTYNVGNIMSLFEEFCTTYEYDMQEGIEYLKSSMNETT